VAGALPDLSSECPVPADRIAEFQREGHTVLRGVCTPGEIAAYRPVIEAAAMAHSRETRPIEQRDTYSRAFLQITNLWVHDDDVKRFVTARRFARIAAELLGVDGVRLYHDQALFKEAGGGYTPWHQDQFYWPFDSDKTITMWMPLVAVSEEIGSMTFAAGTHRLGYLGEFGISDESHAAFQALVDEKGIELRTHGACAAGDATFHAGWTLHRAPPNPTGTLRSVMTVIYFADGLRAAEPDHFFREYDLKKWLPGVQPGDLAASPLNPRLYP
jgi:ectoine hydroxylase-related dioxygenase (phytanoyl-CoA dioxygenase family)